MNSRRIMVVALVASVAMVCLAAQDDSSTDAAAKNADIRHLMQVTGAGQLGVQVLNQMVTLFKQSKPEIPEKFWQGFMSEVDPNDFVEMCVPIYASHFTSDEIKQIIKFYETPVGKKLVEALPAIMQEAMTAGKDWGQKLGEKVARRLQEQGYK